MDKYLPDAVVEAAYAQDRLLGGRMVTLNKFAVAGFLSDEGYFQMCTFLDEQNIAYEGNGKTLVWLGVLDKSLTDLFKKLKQ